MYSNTKEKYILFYFLITFLKLLTHLIPEVEYVFTNTKLYVEEQNSKLLANKQNRFPNPQILQCN